MLNKEQTCEEIQAGRNILETVRTFISSRLVKTASEESSGDFFFTKKGCVRSIYRKCSVKKQS